MFLKLKSKAKIINYFKVKLSDQRIELLNDYERDIKAIELKHKNEISILKNKLDLEKKALEKEKDDLHLKEIEKLKVKQEKDLTIKTNEVTIELNKLARSQKKQDEVNKRLEDEYQRVRNIFGNVKVVESALVQYKQNMDLDVAKIQLLLGHIDNFEKMLNDGSVVEPPVTRNSKDFKMDENENESETEQLGKI